MANIFLAFGIPSLLIAVILGYYQQQFMERSTITEGLVLRLVGRDGDSKAPVVRFKLPNGETITFQSSLKSTPPRFTVEEKVSVRYDPEEPSNAQIANWLEAWFGVLLSGVLGVVFSSIGVFARRLIR